MRFALAGLVASLASLGLGIIPPPPPKALPSAPPPRVAIAGVPEPCPSVYRWPAEVSPARTTWMLEQVYGLELTGEQWTDPRYRSVVKIIWQTLDGLKCTDYVAKVKAHSGQKVIKIHAGSTRSWAWGDWSLTHPGKLTFDLSKWVQVAEDDPGRLVRLVVHEMGHMYNVNRFGSPKYWTTFNAQYRATGRFSSYAHNDTETFADVLGYYVARCAKDNPFDTGKYDAYYEWAKKNIFKGVEFGPEPGVKADCSVGS